MKEQIYDLKGRAGMWVCTAGRRQFWMNGQLYEAERGMLCFISPIIAIYELSRDDDYAEVSITDEAEVFYHAIKQVYSMIFELMQTNPPCLRLDEERLAFFIARHDEIEQKRSRIAESDDPRERNILTHSMHLLEQQTLLEMVLLYCKGQTVKPKPAARNETVLFKFIYAVNTNPNHERSVAFYAREQGLSPNHFTRIIREQTGKTPSEWIATITIVNAKILLKQPGMNVKAVAAELNFPEQYTFRKFFKLHVGIPPKEFRNRHLNAHE
ncbi:MAG: helix-turn-helix domain-containing protein [Alloprevotella sp.]